MLKRPLYGTAFGVDFNPAVDRLRVVSNTGQNLRINVATRARPSPTVRSLQRPDAGNGTGADASQPLLHQQLRAASTTTTLFDVDTARDVLVQPDPANDGTLDHVGAAGRRLSS